MRATNDAQGTWLTLKPLDHTLRSGDSASDAEAWVNRQKNTIWIHLIQFVGHFHQFSCGITLGNHWVSISMLIYWNYFILLEGNSFQFCSIFPPAPLMQDIFLDHFSNGPWPLYDPQKWTFSIDLGKNNWWTDGRNSSFFTGCWQIKHLATRLVNLV